MPGQGEPQLVQQPGHASELTGAQLHEVPVVGGLRSGQVGEHERLALGFPAGVAHGVRGLILEPAQGTQPVHGRAVDVRLPE